MKPNIPWTARWKAWWHEALTGHRIETVYRKGKYHCMRCRYPLCDRWFHWNRE